MKVSNFRFIRPIHFNVVIFFIIHNSKILSLTIVITKVYKYKRREERKENSAIFHSITLYILTWNVHLGIN